MDVEEKKKHCAGCYNDDYNHGLGGAKQCWMLESAELIPRKMVHINQVPPWKQAPELYLSCRKVPQYVFINGDREY